MFLIGAMLDDGSLQANLVLVIAQSLTEELQPRKNGER